MRRKVIFRNLPKPVFPALPAATLEFFYPSYEQTINLSTHSPNIILSPCAPSPSATILPFSSQLSSLEELCIAIHLSGSTDWTQAVSLCSKCLNPLRPLTVSFTFWTFLHCHFLLEHFPLLYLLICVFPSSFDDSYFKTQLRYHSIFFLRRSLILSI